MGYCIFRGISENKASLWIAVFSEIFPKIQQPYRLLYFAKYLSKYSLPFLLTFNRSIDFNHISLYSDVMGTIQKACRKEIPNIST